MAGHTPVDERNSEVDGMRMSRRAFLGTAGAAAGALLASRAWAAPDPPPALAEPLPMTNTGPGQIPRRDPHYGRASPVPARRVRGAP